MLSFALMSILNVVACKVSKHGIDFIVILPFVILRYISWFFFALYATKHSE
jgi:hypothetical protein